MKTFEECTNILWVDVESTGFSEHKNDIVQIGGIIEIDGVEKEEFNFKCRPLNPENISMIAMDIIGKPQGKTAEEMKIEVMTYLDPKDVYHELLRILGRYIDKWDPKDKFIAGGQNVDFDKRMLRGFFEKQGDKFFGSWIESNTSLDTLQIATICVKKGKIPRPENFKLKTLCNLFGIELKAHDALEDIRATKDLATKLLKLLG